MNMNNQKGFANVVLIGIIVVLIGVVGYFAFVKKSEPVAQQTTPPPTTTQTPTPQQPSPTPINETASWKTYKNDTYSFEVKYPSDWTSKGSWSENGGFFYVAFGTANLLDSKPFATLRVYPNQTTLDKFIKYFDYVGGTWKNVSLGGVAAKEVVSTGQNSKQFILTASVKNSYGFELASTVFGDNVDTVRKMNSTFQFLK